MHSNRKHTEILFGVKWKTRTEKGVQETGKGRKLEKADFWRKIRVRLTHYLGLNKHQGETPKAEPVSSRVPVPT